MTAKPGSSNIGKLIGCLAIGAVVLIVLVAAIVGAVVFLPGLTRPATPPAAKVNAIVNFIMPLDDSTVPLDRSTAIQVDGLSAQPILSLELWVDGARFASKTIPQTGQTQFFGSWGWMPPSVGDHTLVVRALDAAQHAVDSNPVHVTASAEPTSTIAVNYPVKPGETADSIAKQFETTPQQIVDLNPQLGPASPITPGLTISVPLPIPAAPAAPSSPSTAPGPGAGSPITPSGSITVPNPVPPPGGAGAPSSPSTASIKLETAHLVTTQPMIGVYCYLSVDNAPATRVPAIGFIAFVKSPLEFDLTSSLPALTVAPGQKAITVLLDCWGLSIGPPPALVHLGSATGTVDPAKPNAPLTLTVEKFKLNANLPTLSPYVKGILSHVQLSVPTPFIYPPSGVTDTTDPGACLFCAEAIQNHWLVLKWDWISPPTYVEVSNPQKQYDVIQDIDGYRVYENDYFFQHIRVTATSAGPELKATPFSPPPIPSSSDILLMTLAADRPRCFVVRAYKGSVESTDSNSWCLSGAIPGTQTITLQPSRFRTVRREHDGCSGLCGGAPFSLGGGPTAGEVGYRHWDDGSQDIGTAVRGLVLFDLSAVNGPVWKSTLVYHLDGGTIGGGGLPPISGNWSCASQLMLPTEGWPSSEDFTPADPYLDIRLTDMVNNYYPTDFSTDVTSAVRNWQLYGSNFGFELRGKDEDIGAEDNWTCDSTYSGFQLQVEYFPK
jgi:LysM repeat protein